MLQFAALFIPGLFSMEIEDFLNKRQSDRSGWRFLQRYGLYTLLNLTTVILLIKIIHPGFTFSDNGNLSDDYLCDLYFVLMPLCATFWGYITRILSLLMNVSVEKIQNKVEENNADHDNT